MEATVPKRSRLISLLLTIAVHLIVVLIFYSIHIITKLPPFEIKPVPELQVELELGDGGGIIGKNENPNEPGGGGEAIGKQTAVASQEVAKSHDGEDVKVYSQPKAEGKSNTPPSEDPRLKSLADRLGKTGPQGPGEGPAQSDSEGPGWSAIAGDGSGIEGTGRKIVAKPKITHDSQEGGSVMVEIIVNPQGEVIYARATLNGSTTADHDLWEQAEREAMKIRFNPKSDAPAKARGRIRIVFEVN